MSRKTRKARVAPNYQSLEQRRMLACNLSGTPGNDVIHVQVGTQSVSVTINGNLNECDREEINIDALGGHDFVWIVDDAGNDQAELRPDSVSIAGAVNINVANIESSQVNSGGGQDVASLFDSTGDESVFIDSAGILMKGPGFQQRVNGYDQAFAISSGGTDDAFISDSNGDDVFVGDAFNSRMNYPDSFVDVFGFSNVYVTSRLQGNDQAVFNGSAGNDVVYSTQNFSLISNNQYMIRATGFERVLANDSPGFDRATIVDTTASDVFYGNSGFANFKYGTNDARISLIEFEKVSSIELAGSERNNIGYLFGTDANDQLYGRESATVLIGTGYEFFLNRFSFVDVTGNGGLNSANFIDDFGDALFAGGRNKSRFNSPTGSFQILASGFKKLNATSLGDGNSRAIFSNNFQGGNRFYANPNSARLVSPTLNITAQGFRQVESGARGDDNIAIVVGSENDDVLEGPHRLHAADDSYYIFAGGYQNLYVDGRGGHDIAIFENAVSDRKFTFSDGRSLFQSTYFSVPQSQWATGFESFEFRNNPTYGGFSKAVLYDTSDDDFLEVSEGRVTLTGGGYVVSVETDEVFATANRGGINTVVYNEPFLNGLYLYGDWFVTP